MSQLLDLRTLHPHIVTVPWYRDRHFQIYQMLETVGFAEPIWHFAGKTRYYWQGAHGNFLRILKSTTLPVLIFEDDATLLPNYFQPLLSYPDDADVVYLGGTCIASVFRGTMRKSMRMGRSSTKERLVYEDYDKDYVRIYNMHSAHAILFLTAKGAGLYQLGLEEIHGPHDVAFSRVMGDCKTYLRRNPFWYQQDGRNDQFTQNYLPARVGKESGRGT